MPVKDDTTATTTARSAAGSMTRKPPTTFKYTSRLHKASLRRFSTTAQSSNNRWMGKPSDARRGLILVPPAAAPAEDAPTSPCICGCGHDTGGTRM